MRSDNRYVYFMKPIGMDGPVKIGCSESPIDRLSALAAWSPFPLEIATTAPGRYEDEQYLHSCFANTHLHREWFNTSPLLQWTIERVKQCQSLDWIKVELKPTGNIRSRGKGSRSAPAYRDGYRSYSARVMWAEKKLRRLDEYSAWQTPDDVSQILRRWFGVAYKNIEGVRPSEAEFARLHEYLSDPASHSVLPSWRRAA